VLIRTIVIAGDGAGADVHFAADRCIADVGQVIHLATRPDLAVFNLNEISNMRIRSQSRARSDARERPDAAIVANLRVFDMTKGLYFRAFRHGDISQHTVRADADIIGQRHFSFEHTIDINDDISAAIQLAAHIEARRIENHHPAIGELLRIVALIDALQLGQLQFAVYPQHFPSRVWVAGFDRHALTHRHGDGIGQVVLALRVVVLQLAQPARELGAGCDENAGIDFTDLTLGIGGIFLLHNALDSPIGTAHDAPVTGRVGEFSGE